MPYAFALQSLPKVAIAPLIVIWCGFGDGSKVAMAALLAFFPMLVNSFAGMRSADIERIELMKALSATRFETYRLVKLPSAAPVHLRRPRHGHRLCAARHHRRRIPWRAGGHGRRHHQGRRR
jgi:ABC-type nitrate/sulfonate/bicarbonate transport system permease component